MSCLLGGILIAVCGYGFSRFFYHAITVQWSIVGAANQCLLLYFIFLVIFYLTGGAKLRKRVGRANFNQSAPWFDRMLLRLMMLFAIASILLMSRWGLQVNPTFSYQHGRGYYT